MELWLFGSIGVYCRYGRSVSVFGKDSVATISKRRHQNVRGDGMKKFTIYVDKHDGSKNYTIFADSRDAAVKAFRKSFGYSKLIDMVVEVR
jgi:hypothetical protein